MRDFELLNENNKRERESERVEEGKRKEKEEFTFEIVYLSIINRLNSVNCFDIKGKQIEIELLEYEWNKKMEEERKTQKHIPNNDGSVDRKCVRNYSMANSSRGNS